MRSDHLRRELAAALMRIDARDLANASGLPVRIIGLARARRPISARHFLRLAAAINLDPMPP